MDKTEAQAKLKEIDNLSEFSSKSGLARRTLQRIKAGEGGDVNRTTLIAIEAAIKRLRPKSTAKKA
jgi:hypothetical protein